MTLIDEAHQLAATESFSTAEAKAMIVRLADALEQAGKDAGRWIPVSERLPEIDQAVWLWDGTNIWYGSRVDEFDGWLWAKSYSAPDYYAGEWTCEDAETDDDYQPTHWKPLPEPPAIDAAMEPKK